MQHIVLDNHCCKWGVHAWQSQNFWKTTYGWCKFESFLHTLKCFVEIRNGTSNFSLTQNSNYIKTFTFVRHHMNNSHTFLWWVKVKQIASNGMARPELIGLKRQREYTRLGTRGKTLWLRKIMWKVQKDKSSLVLYSNIG